MHFTARVTPAATSPVSLHLGLLDALWGGRQFESSVHDGRQACGWNGAAAGHTGVAQLHPTSHQHVTL